MIFAHKINIRLVMIVIGFMIIFVTGNNFLVNIILDKSVELTCNVYYNQISSRVHDEIDLLKITTEKIATDQKIINILDDNRRFEDLSKEESDLILEEIDTFEGILEVSSFAKTINIASLTGDYLSSKGIISEYFDLTRRPWFEEEYLTSKPGTIITDIHRDFTTGLDTIAIVSFIYSENQELLGAVVLDILLRDLLEYSNSSFYTGDLETLILRDGIILYPKYSESKYTKASDWTQFTSKADSFLGNENDLVFAFNKNSIKNNSYMDILITLTTFILLTTGLFISIAFGIFIQLSFRPAVRSIKKLKYLLGDLDEGEISFQDMNEFKQLELISDSLGKSFDKKVQSLIYYDELTKLPNRKKLKLICKELIDNNTQFALVFLDLNKFKVINDVYGHSAGDQLLIKFSSIIQNALGDKGIITRYSGDEFIIVFTDFKSSDHFKEYYQNEILSKFKKPIEINKDLKTFITFSTGVAVYPRDGLEVDELINKSDFMMYKNKNDNINDEILFFNDDIYLDMLYVENIKNQLKHVCERNELILNYQPIYNKNGEVIKAEVLLRWKSKELGLIPPGQFIQYAEDTRDIIPIGYWVIEEVCKSIQKNNWKIGISINVSPIQLTEFNFVKNVEAIMEKYHVSYHQLYFEITESVLLDNHDTVCNNIRLLREKGIKLALDDFGTGYASFNYLTKYSLDILKIDKVFLDDTFKNNFQIIHHIKKISNVLNMKVVIEGVETEEQFEKLKELECDFFQGYYFSKPLSKEDFIATLEGK